MLRRVAVLACAGFTVLSAVADEVPGRTFTIDAVELIRSGKEVPGDPAQVVEHNGYTYRFAGAESRAAFLADPARYEIQLGGACARMGPLSGEGRCDIFTVHEGRLYIFASPQCRETFLKVPEKLLETDDPPVKADAAAMQRGKELLELAVKAHGGAAALDAVRTYRQRIDVQAEHNGQSVRNDRVYMQAFPDRGRDETWWGDSVWIQSVAGDRGAFATAKGLDRAMVASQVRSFRRQMHQNLLAVLKARTRPGFVAAHIGEATVDGTRVERVAVWFDGCTRTLGIDPATGRVRTLAYRAWGGERLALGIVEKTFLDWQTVDGVTLPVSWTATFDGQPSGAKPTRLSRIELNAKLDDALFAVRD